MFKSVKSFFFGSLWQSIISMLLILITAWLLLSLYLLSQSTQLIFNNTVSWAPIPNVGYKLNYIRNSDNQNISLAYFKAQNPTNETILYLHGNTGRINTYFEHLTQEANVLSPAYPGYHESEGNPNVENVYETAELSYNWLVQEKGVKPENITIMGHSMGGSPAVYLASKKPEAKQLVLINTFSNIQSMCFRDYSIFCVFAGDIFNSAKYAEKVNIPVYQFAYPGDLTVPFEEGEKLFTYFNNTNTKNFYELNEYTHTYPDFEFIFDKIDL